MRNMPKYLFSVASKVLLIAVAFSVVCLPLRAETSFSKLKEKAERFYAYQEWDSALAMYELMLMQQPSDLPTLSLAIALYGLKGEEEKQLQLVELSQQKGIALNDLFSTVKKEAFRLGKPEIYENLLLKIKEKQPWLKRSINLQLIKYYDSRNNAPKMISISDSLLAVNPDDVYTLSIKARGHILLSEIEPGVAAYRKILELDKDNMEALLNIGIVSYNEVKQKRLPLDSPTAVEARSCLQRAYSLKPTQFLKHIIGELTPQPAE